MSYCAGLLVGTEFNKPEGADAVSNHLTSDALVTITEVHDARINIANLSRRPVNRCRNKVLFGVFVCQL